jgi:hypothetical protein
MGVAGQELLFSDRRFAVVWTVVCSGCCSFGCEVEKEQSVRELVVEKFVCWRKRKMEESL